MPADKRKAPPLLLTRLELIDIRGFAKVDLSFTDRSGPRLKTLIVGENGHGKTTLLRAIALGLSQADDGQSLMRSLAGSMRRQTKKKSVREGQITVTLQDPLDGKTLYRISSRITGDEGKEKIEQQTEPKNFPWDRIFACGYGVNRGTHSYLPMERYLYAKAVKSLFEGGALLYDPEAVLKTFKLGEPVEGPESNLSWLKRQLIHVLNLASKDKIEIGIDGVMVSGAWGTLPFRALGDGYRGTAGWLLDFLAKAQSANLIPADKSLLRGIVLIDEIDEHLHPEWQRKILTKLSKLFPSVQFIGTTHSPMTLVKCQPGEVISCRLSNAVATAEQDLPPLEGHTADQILRGEWFGLKETMAPETEALLARYRNAIEHKHSEQQLRHLRDEIRQKIGSLSVTPLDELALEIANAYREQVAKGMDPQARKEMIQQAVERMKARLA